MYTWLKQKLSYAKNLPNTLNKMAKSIQKTFQTIQEKSHQTFIQADTQQHKCSNKSKQSKKTKKANGEHDHSYKRIRKNGKQKCCNCNSRAVKYYEWSVEYDLYYCSKKCYNKFSGKYFCFRKNNLQGFEGLTKIRRGF